MLPGLRRGQIDASRFLSDHAANLATCPGLLAENWPGDFNQAMMELGAAVCLPLKPRCHVPGPQMVCDAGRTCARRAAFSPKQETNLVCAGVAQWKRQGESKSAELMAKRMAMAAARLATCNVQESFAHARYVGAAANRPNRHGAVPATTHWRTFRHSITVTDYTVHVFEPASDGTQPRFHTKPQTASGSPSITSPSFPSPD